MRTITVKIFSIIFLGSLVLFFWYWSLYPLTHIVNIYPFNFPREKREPSFLCKLDHELTIRAYHGYGSHATTSDSNGVYVQFSSQPFERAIWRAYSSPFLEKISCNGDYLLITTSSENPDLSSFSISASKIKEDLVNKPIRISYGERKDSDFQNGTDLFCLSTMLFPGGLCFLAMIRILKKKSTI